MRTKTFDDIIRFRRCPYAYRLDRRAENRTITLRECMDVSVRNALMRSECNHLLNGELDPDSPMTDFWDNWGRNIDDVHPKPEKKNIEMIRYGERCIENYLGLDRKVHPNEIIAVDITATVKFGDVPLLLHMDEVRRYGPTVVLCSYVTDPDLKNPIGLRSADLLVLGAKWASENLAGVRIIKLRWEFLGSGVVSEYTVTIKDIEETVGRITKLMEEMESDGDVLPRESEHCRECVYRRDCPRFTHELMLTDEEFKSKDIGVQLVDSYIELDEKISALKRRAEVLEANRDVIGGKLISYAKKGNFMAVCGNDGKALIRYEKKVDLPEDKTELIKRLKATGEYEKRCMVNYQRLRSDIAKGIADPAIVGMCEINTNGKIYLRKNID